MLHVVCLASASAFLTLELIFCRHAAIISVAFSTGKVLIAMKEERISFDNQIVKLQLSTLPSPVSVSPIKFVDYANLDLIPVTNFHSVTS